ncbi:MAG TPA: farnesyl diphosphate synthase [Thermoanaerobaculia bacterium]|nr:farnesyl diphosphate synthase [Thermoanaerobaculia bacterium]
MSTHPPPSGSSASAGLGEFEAFLEAIVPRVEDALDRLLPAANEPPASLHEAMRYSLFAGGKRVRPALVLLAGETLGARRDDLLEPAAALEMIHTFSLIHDDLPALDDDDLRRGRPTLHRAFDEPIAILAGDALLDLGLQVVAEHPPGLEPEWRLRAVSALAAAVGSRGMIGGQVDDLAAERGGVSPETSGAVELLESIHRRKTGALLVASLEIGGLCARAGEGDFARLRRLGDLVGLLFQIRDDVLDVEATTEALGKTAGKDERAAKLTYPRLYGIEESKRMLARYAEEAEAVAAELPEGGAIFRSLIGYLTQRGS